MKNNIILIAFLFVYFNSNAQLIDSYGIRGGIGYSNTYWYFDDIESKQWKEKEIGFYSYIYAEKKLTDYVSIRSEIGYNQIGFKDLYMLGIGDSIYQIDIDVNLHNLSTNLYFKLSPFKTKLKPYLIPGLRFDYLFLMEYLESEVNGWEIGAYRRPIDELNKSVLSGGIALGIDFYGFIYIEIEYNRAITKNFNGVRLNIKHEYKGLSLGLNLSKLIKKNKSISTQNYSYNL